jgi:hypothetical protein
VAGLTRLQESDIDAAAVILDIELKRSSSVVKVDVEFRAS